jgi:hypothetical protein
MSPDKGHVVNVNSSTLIMGPTGSGKSALLGTLAEYVWETFERILLLYSTDGGGFPARVQTLAQQGLIWIWRMRTRDIADGSLAFETCARATQGWWPKLINPRTGETTPAVQLVPPITEKYDMHCENGHLIKSVPFQSMLVPTICPTCKRMTDRTTMKVKKTSHRTKGFEKVGAVAFDGLTSMVEWLMTDMRQRSGRLELKGEEGAIGGKIISGDYKLGSNSRSHYGTAQAEASALVHNTLGIPHLVVPPTFTALTFETDDEGGLSIRGPLLTGKAKTGVAGQWFGNCLEPMVIKDDKERRVFRLYLSEFVDEAGVRHLTKNRADPGILPDYLEDPPLEKGHEAETAFTNFHLGVFNRLLEDGLKKSGEEMAQRYPNAPGLPEGIVEVGEGVAEMVPAPIAGNAQPSSVPAVAPAVARPSTVPVGRPGVAPVTSKPAVAAQRPAASPAPPAKPAGGAPAPVQAASTSPPAGQPQKWAAPAAPRPPAPAPRVGPLAKPAGAAPAVTPQKEA